MNLLEKILDFITGESEAQRKHDEWVRDFHRRWPPPGSPPRIVTMDEVLRRLDRVIAAAYRRGDLPVPPDHPWAKHINK